MALFDDIGDPYAALGFRPGWGGQPPAQAQQPWPPSNVAASALKTAAARQAKLDAQKVQKFEPRPGVPLSELSPEEGTIPLQPQYGPGIAFEYEYGPGQRGPEWLAGQGGETFRQGSYGPGGGQRFYPSSPEEPATDTFGRATGGGLADMMAEERSRGLYDETFPTPEFDLPETNLRQAAMGAKRAGLQRQETMLSPVVPGQEAQVPKYGADVMAERANPMVAYQVDLDKIKQDSDREEAPILAHFRQQVPGWDPTADPHGVALPPEVRQQYWSLMEQVGKMTQMKIERIQQKHMLALGSRIGGLGSMERQMGVQLGPGQEPY